MKVMGTARFALLLANVLVLLPGAAVADNWMRSEDEFYFKATLAYDRADERWNQERQLTPISCTSSNLSHYQSYEYGLSYYYTAFGSLNYLERHCGNVDASGMGDVTLGLRGRLNLYRNGRTWEAAAIIPTFYRTTGDATIGSGLYGLRLGVFGSFGNSTTGDELNIASSSKIELGGNVFFWEGTAPEQFSGYVKFNLARTKKHRLYGAVEVDYALIDRKQEFKQTVNQVDVYGYDRLNLRLGYARRVSLYWQMSVEATQVVQGRNTSKTTGVSLNFSRSFTD